MRYLIATLTLLIGTSGALAQESWVGKTILTKKDGIQIGYTDDQGRQKYVGELHWPSYKVTGDQGGWLKVTNEHGVSGWFDKTQAVLLDNATAYYTDLINRDPGDPDLYFMRATAWKLKNRIDLAIKDLNEALRIDPGWDAALSDRGLLWSDKKEYEKAIADFTAALRIRPNAVTYDNRGHTWNRMKEYGKALADFAESIRLDPEYVLAYDDQAWLLATCPDSRYRDGRKAIEIAKKGMTLDPKDPSLMDTLAAAYAEIGDFVQAVFWQERAMEDPDWNFSAARRRLELYRNRQPFRQDP